jgi:hypothetical protein
MRVITTAMLLVGLVFPPAVTAAQEMNACGCYRDAGGACKCTSKIAKCTCPGDCEPVGCEAKRQKEANREAEATLKKIQLREKKKAAEAARASRSKAKSKAKTDKEAQQATKDLLGPGGQ